MYKQTGQTHGGKQTCLRCLSHFTCERTLNNHVEKCLKLHDGECAVRKLKEGSVAEFKNVVKMEKAPYVVYADFESVIDKVTGTHKACEYATNLVNSLGESLKSNLYRGEDCMPRFFDNLDAIRDFVDTIPKADMIITPQQQKEFIKSTECYMCGKEYTPEEHVTNWPVKDHDHV